MPNKIFISFLGAIPYYDTRYFQQAEPNNLSSLIPFVQEAIIRQCLPPDWSDNDRVYIFTTEEAKKNNYDNRIRSFDRTTNTAKLEGNNGLQSILSNLKNEGLINHFEAVIIPNGYTETEIFQVFQEIFNRIESNAEIYFDITVGFRSLPMLGIVLLNYAKNVADAKVKAIFYGNYEAGRAEKEEKVAKAKLAGKSEEVVDTIRKSVVEAPILNLLSLSILQDWTAAAGEFIKLGKSESLALLVAETQPELAKQLTGLERSITTCRGKLLTQELNVNELKDTLIIQQNAPIKEQLKPLLSKIDEKIKNFGNADTLQNGFAAVEWCIQHNMIQQGITFLQETLITHVIEKVIGQNAINQLSWRDLSASALSLFRTKGNKNFSRTFLKKPISEQERIIVLYEAMRVYVKSKAPLSKYYKELTGKQGFRNDINHCGFRDDYLSAEMLRESLADLYAKISSLELNQHHAP